jgi:anaerobic magnesium-protoporphyrin IX monomethyl ester cyclase
MPDRTCDESVQADGTRQGVTRHLSMRARKSILLYSPHFVSLEARSSPLYRAMPPLSHLAIAGPLRDAGYDVLILDAKWDEDWRARVSEVANDLLCAGVTSLTGPAVSDGLEFATYVKQLRPDLPVVWGGWHATFVAQQAMEDPRVDVVVRGMGERTFVEVARAIESNGSLREVLGIHFRDGDEIVSTADRPLEDINNFPSPAYELIQSERYLVKTREGKRLASTIFSRGCPYACDFCLDSRNKWLGLSIERMIADVEYWLTQGADRLQLYDGNFFLGRARLIEFCDALVARGLHSRISWIATAVGRRVANMDDELLARLKHAGLAQVAIGAESGSDELLTRITNKTTVEATLEAVRRLTRHGIEQYLFFMVGYPDEPDDALEKTFEFVMRLKKVNPNVALHLNFTTPLPGSEVFRIAVDRKLVEPPRSFEDWARFDYLKPNLFGVGRNYVRDVDRFQRFLNLAYPVPGVTMRLPATVQRLAQWRLERRYLGFPFELSMVNAFRSARARAREW